MTEEKQSKLQLQLRLAEGRKKYQEMREQGLVEATVYTNPTEKAKANPKSLRAAVTAHCWECVGGEHSEKPKVLVRECGIVKCSLHGLRPWQIKIVEETDE